MSYLLFAGHCYYPGGGTRDFRGEFETVDQAKDYFRKNDSKIAGGSYLDIWCEVVEKDSMKSVAIGRMEDPGKPKWKVDVNDEWDDRWEACL